MTIADFLTRLDGVRSRGTGRWSARCPSHQDKCPSLSVQEGDRGLLVHCFAGCTVEEVTAAVNLRVSDLFTDTPIPRGEGPIHKPLKLDLVEVAYRFELAALDRRLRANAVLNAVAKLSNIAITDVQRDRLMNAVARAYADKDRAEFLETVADGFRWKAFEEGRRAHAA